MLKKISHTPSDPSPSWNSGEFYKVIKLRTGELVLCMLEHDLKSVASETYVVLNRPVQAVTRGADKNAETEDKSAVIAVDYKLKEWIDTSSSKEFTVSTDMMTTIGDMSLRLQYQYQEYLKLMDEANDKFDSYTDIIQREASIDELLASTSPDGEYRVWNQEEQDAHDQKAAALRNKQGLS